MKKFSLLFMFLFLSVSFSNLSFSADTAYVYGTDKVVAIHFTNPYDNSTSYDYVGTFNGVVDGVNASFYCTDISHTIVWSGTGYINTGNTSVKITYILNNYYPFDTMPPTGPILSPIEYEAAAVQMAIWHYSDGVDVTTGDQSDIKARALQLIADAESFAVDAVSDATLLITPSVTPYKFYVTALDQSNNPLDKVRVTLTSSTGTLSDSLAVTGSDGKTSEITYTGPDDAVVTASARITLQLGSTYEIITGQSQKLVLAIPINLLKQVTYAFQGPLPVELSSFTSYVNGRNVNLTWETKTEKNSDKFVLEKKTRSDMWEAIASVKAAVLSNSPKNYSYSGTKLQSGKYQYRLKMVDNDGSFSYSRLEAAEVAIPKDFAVSQNYPNPFNPSTKIDYQVPVNAKVILEVYNIAGQKVVELVNQEQSAGYYTVDFSASKLSSGVYIYRLAARDKATGNNISSIKKMTLLK